MDRADDAFCNALELILAAARNRRAARDYEPTTAERLHRYANAVNERAFEALAMMGMGATT